MLSRCHFTFLLCPAGNEDIIDSHLKEEPQARISGPNDSIEPNSTESIDGWPFDEKGHRTTLTAQQIAEIAAGTLTIYGHGRAEYQDVFGRPHWLTFCLYWNHELHDYVACGRGNASDDVPKSATEPEPLQYWTQPRSPDGKARAVPVPSKPLPPLSDPSRQLTLASASLTLISEKGYPDRTVKVAATLVSASGKTIGEVSSSEMTYLQGNKYPTWKFKLQATAKRYDDIYLRLATTPPPKEMLNGIQYTFYWSDGTMNSSSLGTSELPGDDGIWTLFHVNPVDLSISPFPR